jgi:hypothetical protein
MNIVKHEHSQTTEKLYDCTQVTKEAIEKTNQLKNNLLAHTFNKRNDYSVRKYHKRIYQ